MTLSTKLGFGLDWMRGCRGWSPRRRQTRLAGPISAGIQTIDRCNATCPMCPYASIQPQGPPTVMSDELFERVVRELHRPGTVRKICLMLQNEPLLDRRLGDRVRVVREVFGSALELVVVTHGELLTEETVARLHGVDRFAISIDAACRETYRRVRPGLDYDTVVANVLRLLRRGDVRVTTKFVVQRENQGEEDQFARFWRSHGAEVSLDRLCNRAGSLDAFERLWAPRSGVLRTLARRLYDLLVPCCPIPFTTAYVLADGRMITCSHDWEPRDVVGDLSSQSLDEIWHGERINHHRHLLWSRRTDESAVCRDCSIAGRFWEW